MHEMAATEMSRHIPEVANEFITSNIDVVVLKKLIIHDWFISGNQIKIEPYYYKIIS